MFSHRSSTQTVVPIEEILQDVLKKLYAYQGAVDLTHGVSHSKTMGMLRRSSRTLGDLSVFFLIAREIIAFASTYYCLPKVGLIDLETNTALGEYQGNSNNLLLYSNNKLIDGRYSASTKIDRIYDYNNNGIYGEPGERESCLSLLDYRMYLIIIFAVLILGKAMSDCASWYCERAYKQSLFSQKSYDALYEKASTKIMSIEQDFESLSENAKESLIKNGLADKDASSRFTPKERYMCSISFGLIVWPLVVECIDKDNQVRQRLYDLKYILPHLKDNFQDPSTMLPVVRCYFSDEINQDYIHYLTNLENHIKAARFEHGSNVTLRMGRG